MKPASKFWALPLRERFTLIGAAAALLIIDIGLSLFGFKRVYRLLGKLSRDAQRFTGEGQAGLDLARRTAYLVSVAARHGLVRTGCLRQALLTWYLLRRRGIEAEMRIGVRQQQGAVMAHAWVRVAGHVVSEGDEVEQDFSAFEELPTGD